MATKSPTPRPATDATSGSKPACSPPSPRRQSPGTTRSSVSISPTWRWTDRCTKVQPEGTGKNPTDRAKLGWKWSILTDRNGIPIGWAIDGANRHDSVMLEPTLKAAAELGLLADIETLWLGRGYDSDVTRTRLSALGIDDAVIAKKRKPGVTEVKKKQSLGLRWPVERTNSWLSNFGQLRRNTDRKTIHRLAQFALAVALLLIAKLIDWRNRWSRVPSPIR